MEAQCHKRWHARARTLNLECNALTALQAVYPPTITAAPSVYSDVSVFAVLLYNTGFVILHFETPSAHKL